MKLPEILPFVNRTVQISRKNKSGMYLEQSGTIKALTDKLLILDIDDGDEKAIELKGIETIKAIK